MQSISYSDGRTVPSHLVIWEDLHNERAGYVRGFWANPDETAGSPAIGYCSPGGSHRTIRACVAELRRYWPTEPIYRNGRRIA